MGNKPINDQSIRLQFLRMVCGYIPKTEIKQWPDQGNNPKIHKNKGSPTEPVITKTKGKKG